MTKPKPGELPWSTMKVPFVMSIDDIYDPMLLGELELRVTSLISKTTMAAEEVAGAAAARAPRMGYLRREGLMGQGISEA